MQMAMVFYLAIFFDCLRIKSITYLSTVKHAKRNTNVSRVTFLGLTLVFLSNFLEKIVKTAKKLPILAKKVKKSCILL